MLHSVVGVTFALGLVGTALAQTAPPASSCPLTNGPIKHIVYLQFDNVHYQRDRVLVPSDLEQMPALLSFLQTKGTLMVNDHTQVISHTADGIITSITGVYPDRHGQGVSNSYDYFKPTGATAFVSSFVYWTDKVQTSDTSAGSDQTYALVNEAGVNAPAPWAAYTKAGCDFGAVALADMEFENTSSDISNVFGPTSPEFLEGKSNSNQALADFEGIAVHCAQNSALCASSPHVGPDVLPQEPNGYSGFQALFGHKYVIPALNGTAGAATPNTVLNDLSGAPTQFTASSGATFNGFPGFDGMFPKVTLAYAAQMLEAGVPVVYGYISDAHDAHLNTGNFAFGPGEQGYSQQLAAYNAGWTAFFNRLKNDGMDETNTLFIVTVEEGDHFVGGAASPSNCDGVTIFCTYANKGEVDLYMNRVLALPPTSNTTSFDLHFDMSPNAYVTGNPGYNDPTVRKLERDMMSLKVPDPVLNNRNVPVVAEMADRVEQKLLHMTALGDPMREPSFTPFGYQDFFVSNNTSGSTAGCNPISLCVFEAPQFAYNHGGIVTEINKTWFGMVGPGVLNRGVDGTTWTDHVDYRPTMLMLAGIQDSYVHDGSAMVMNIDPSKLPAPIASNLSAYENLVAAYKQLTAPYGATATASLNVSTKAVGSTDETVYGNYVTTMTSFLQQRDTLAGSIKNYIDTAAFGGGPFDPTVAATFTSSASALTAQMQAMANGS
jgi:hypothetical protein